MIDRQAGRVVQLYIAEMFAKKYLQEVERGFWILHELTGNTNELGKLLTNQSQMKYHLPITCNLFQTAET